MKGWIAIPTRKTQNNDILLPISIKATELTVLAYWECAECGWRIPYGFPLPNYHPCDPKVPSTR